MHFLTEEEIHRLHKLCDSFELSHAVRNLLIAAHHEITVLRAWCNVKPPEDLEKIILELGRLVNPINPGFKPRLSDMMSVIISKALDTLRAQGRTLANLGPLQDWLGDLWPTIHEAAHAITTAARAEQKACRMACCQQCNAGYTPMKRDPKSYFPGWWHEPLEEEGDVVATYCQASPILDRMADQGIEP